MKKLALLVMALSLLTGFFGGKFKKLEVGMERAQVIRLLGRPDGVRTHENLEALTYADRLISGTGWGRANYVVVLKDGRVSEYGPGSVRDASPNTGTFVFVPL